MDNKIIFNNEQIAKYIMFKLNKDENCFSNNEVKMIREIVIDLSKENDGNCFKELELLSNLEMVIIRNGYILNKDLVNLEKLNSLKNITFEKCEFENASLIASLKLNSLGLIDCEINNYTFVGIMTNLNSLKIINGIIDINIINYLKNINYLQISSSKLINERLDLKLDKINTLLIDNTNIFDLVFLKNLKNLKKVYLDEKQLKDNSDLVLELEKNGVEIHEIEYDSGDTNGL